MFFVLEQHPITTNVILVSVDVLIPLLTAIIHIINSNVYYSRGTQTILLSRSPWATHIIRLRAISLSVVTKDVMAEV